MSIMKNGTWYCDFCGKSQHEAFVLISGPMVAICDECIALAVDIVHERKQAATSKIKITAEGESWKQPQTTLESLQPTAQLLQQLQQRVQYLEAEIRAWRGQLPHHRNLTPAEVRLQCFDSEPAVKQQAIADAQEDERLQHRLELEKVQAKPNLPWYKFWGKDSSKMPERKPRTHELVCAMSGLRGKIINDDYQASVLVSWGESKPTQLVAIGEMQFNSRLNCWLIG